MGIIVQMDVFIGVLMIEIIMDDNIVAGIALTTIRGTVRVVVHLKDNSDTKEIALQLICKAISFYMMESLLHE